MFKARKKKEEKLSIELNIDGEMVAFELVQPTFEVKALAIEKLLGPGDGNMHLIKAGQVIVDGCYSGDIVEVKKDDDVYLSLCMKAAEIVRIYEGELKKN